VPAEHPFLARFAAWAEGRDDVRAVVVLGPRPDPTPPSSFPARAADLDLLVVSTSPLRYLERSAWVEEIAPIRATYLEPTDLGAGLERRVLFADGSSVDLTVVSPEDLRAPGGAPATAGGAHIVLDKDGHAGRVLGTSHAAKAGGVGLPAVKEFEAAVSDFWYHVVRAARRVRRGEVWVAARSCEGHLGALLARMVAWHHAAGAPGAPSTPGGWTGAAADEAATGALAREDAGDVARALRSSMDLFGTLSRDTAARLGYQDPAALAAFSRGLVESLLTDVARP
jgi:hypothetical protein